MKSLKQLMDEDLDYGPDEEIDEELLAIVNEAWEAALVEVAFEQNMIELAQMPCSKTIH